MPIQEANLWPATDERNPFESQAETAYRLFLQEVDSTDGWETLADSDGVKTEKKGNPDGVKLPLLRGSCVIPGVKTSDLVGAIQLGGMRKFWDPRFDTDWLFRRFSTHIYQWYQLGLPPRGLGWLISPRDCTGISNIYIDGKTDGFLGGNEDILLVQASAVDDQRAPVVRNRTRMNLDLNGWRLTPQGNDVRVTYLIKIDLNGRIPSGTVTGIVSELPGACGRVASVVAEHGYPPYIRPNPTTSAQSIQQNETLDLKAKQWTYRFTARTGGDFEIAYDTNRMYPGGVAVQVQEAGAEGIRVSDDGAGTVKVQVDQAADGKRVMIVTRPKAGGAAKR